MFPLSNAGEEEVIKSRSSLLLQRNYPEDVLRRFEVFLPYLRRGFQSVLLVPLVVNNQVVGILTFLATRQNAFSKEDLRLAEKVSNRLAEALAQAQFRSACQVLGEQTWRDSEASLPSVLECNSDVLPSLDLAGISLNISPAFPG